LARTCHSRIYLRAGVEPCLPVAAAWEGVLDAPDRSYRMASIEYGHTVREGGTVSANDCFRVGFPDNLDDQALHRAVEVLAGAVRAAGHQRFRPRERCVRAVLHGS